ncbi:hypothetical protein [Pseudomonas sp. 22 E 5]|jgi:hypothetical protein|uniref:Uncharacterized protein n=1 Tax=Pseudomonas fluorescens TaxID=294 RepID=A0A4Y9T9J8_PSEFL|nr:hypothetical protein E4T65_22930 [Pseudomonas fluorescens]TKJ61201.1 hypothetical protein PspCFBP13506_17885 [Pseudomonas sp. CFBP13506]CRM93942.1 hypothetical protein [Pseudomonas sp. 22 E 5]
MHCSIGLFKRVKKYRHFALLDTHGRCIAFMSCQGIPARGEWVEVNAVNVAWLGQTLPGRGHPGQQ